MPSPIVTNLASSLNGKRLLTTLDFFYYRVEDYGAVGDGVTNDYAAIIAAINAAAIVGGTVVFGPKTYATLSSIIYDQAGRKPIKLIGAGRHMNLQVAGLPGTEIKYTNGVGTDKVFELTSLNGFQMTGFNIDCGTANKGIYLGAAVASVIDEINIKNSKGYAYHYRATTAGIYRCLFSNLSTEDTCDGAMLLDSTDIAVGPVDIAECTFSRLELNYNNTNALKITSADNNLFIGLVVRCNNTSGVAGNQISLDAATANQYGAQYNTFVQVDGATTVGGARGVRSNSLITNICYGFSTVNGLFVDPNGHPETFLIHDTTGAAQSNLFQLVSGKAFGGSSVLAQFYFDTSALKTRFQNHDAATRRGWVFSGNRAADAEVEALTISPDGQIFQLARANAIGEFASPAFAAGDFTASAGTWTVPNPVSTYQWTLTGKKMTVIFDIQGTTVSNAGVQLRLKVPAGFVVAAGKSAYNPIRSTDNGGAAVTGLALAVGGNAYITLYATIAGGGFAISVANTSVQGEVTFEVV